MMHDETTTRPLPSFLRLITLFIQLILFISIQLIFIPFAIIGIIISIYKEMFTSKRLGVSFSAIKSLQYRWIMHQFGTRIDPLSVEFTKKFPCESHFGMWTIMGPLIISQRLFGFTTNLGKLVKPGHETLYSCAGIRVLLFDEIMKKYVDEVEQIVMPGAGFDLMALHFTRGKQVKVFELDQVPTLRIKVETMKNAGIEHDWITYIPVDYAHDSWVDRLLESGFDKRKRSLFIWQSVSLYLEEDVVKENLQNMAHLIGEDGIVAQDFYSTALMSGRISKMAHRNMDIINKMGEPWKFTIEMSEDPHATVESFVNECGLRMTEYIQFGDKLNLEPFYCIVEAEKA